MWPSLQFMLITEKTQNKTMANVKSNKRVAERDMNGGKMMLSWSKWRMRRKQRKEGSGENGGGRRNTQAETYKESNGMKSGDEGRHKWWEDDIRLKEM